MSAFLKKKKFGYYAEDLGVHWLEKKGYKIARRNFRSRRGEIDIIAVKNKEIHFVEVKARRSLKYGMPEEAVNTFKIKRFVQTAQVFLKYFPEFEDYDLKFDVLSIYYADKNYKIELIENILI